MSMTESLTFITFLPPPLIYSKSFARSNQKQHDLVHMCIYVKDKNRYMKKKRTDNKIC